MRIPVVILIAAITSIGVSSPATATGPFGAAAQARSGGTPVTITGRIVLEDGQPVAGVEMWSPPRPASGGGFMPGLPTIEIFNGVPQVCFSADPGSPSRIVTDGDGRYRLTMRFHPDVESRGRRCSEFRSALTAANATLIPMPTGVYEFRRATGPLPARRINVPAGSITPQKALPKGGFDPSKMRQ